MPKSTRSECLAIYDQLLATGVELGGSSRINVLYLAWFFFDNSQVLQRLVRASFIFQPLSRNMYICLSFLVTIHLSFWLHNGWKSGIGAKVYKLCYLVIHDQLLATGVELGRSSRVNVLCLAWSICGNSPVLHRLVIARVILLPLSFNLCICLLFPVTIHLSFWLHNG